MVSASVYIVFLDKCQPMTFFKVIYSPQKADAVPAFVHLCSLLRSFTAVITYISHSTRNAWMHILYAHTHARKHTDLSVGKQTPSSYFLKQF